MNLRQPNVNIRVPESKGKNKIKNKCLRYFLKTKAKRSKTYLVLNGNGTFSIVNNCAFMVQ